MNNFEQGVIIIVMVSEGLVDILTKAGWICKSREKFEPLSRVKCNPFCPRWRKLFNHNKGISAPVAKHCHLSVSNANGWIIASGMNPKWRLAWEGGSEFNELSYWIWVCSTVHKYASRSEFCEHSYWIWFCGKVLKFPTGYLVNDKHWWIYQLN